jgi:hypothetical protein
VASTQLGSHSEWREVKGHLGLVPGTVSVWYGAHLTTRFGKQMIVLRAAVFGREVYSAWDAVGPNPRRSHVGGHRRARPVCEV